MTLQMSYPPIAVLNKVAEVFDLDPEATEEDLNLDDLAPQSTIRSIQEFLRVFSEETSDGYWAALCYIGWITDHTLKTALESSMGNRRIDSNEDWLPQRRKVYDFNPTLAKALVDMGVCQSPGEANVEDLHELIQECMKRVFGGE